MKPSPPTVGQLVEALATLAPLRLAADWDNVGLIAGDLRASVESVMLCIDLMPAVVDEACQRRHSFIVAYHPPIFRPLARLVVPDDDRMESSVFRCIRSGIAVYTPHTALDAARGGTNEVLAGLCGASSSEPIEPDAEEPAVGQGRHGPLDEPTTLGALAKRLGQRTGAGCVSGVGDAEAPVRRVVVLVGAAGSTPFSLALGPGDCIVTGEIRHHDALRIQRLGACAVALSHWSSERPALAPFSRALEEAAGVEVCLSEADREPFQRL